MKSLINYNFWFVIIGNAVAGISKGVVYTGCPLLALKWFFPKNTPLVTSILLFVQVLILIPSFWFPKYITDLSVNQTNIEYDKEKITNMLMYEAIICTVMVIPALIFFKESPPTPPCEVSV